jgi:hypothetical protein
MNIRLIGPGDIGEVIVKELRDADYPLPPPVAFPAPDPGDKKF